MTLLPPILFSFGAIEEEFLKLSMLVATLLWFMAVPLYFKERTND